MAFAGRSHTSAKSERKTLSLSAIFVIMFIFWYSSFPLLSILGVELSLESVNVAICIFLQV